MPFAGKNARFGSCSNSSLVRYSLCNVKKVELSGTEVVDENVAEQRIRFSGLHELVHHLFEMLRDGDLKALLKDYLYDSPELARAFEERLCDAAAALLIMPKGVLEQVLSLHGHGPGAVVELMDVSGASVQAALRRVIWHRNVPSFGLVVRRDGYVIDSVSYGHSKDYSVGRNYYIEPDHALREPICLNGFLDAVKAPIPFSNGNRNWKMRLRTCTDSRGRIIAFCNRSQDIQIIDDRQPSLFG